MILASEAPLPGDIDRLRGLGQKGKQVIWILHGHLCLGSDMVCERRQYRQGLRIHPDLCLQIYK